MSQGLRKRRDLAPGTIMYNSHPLWSENSLLLSTKWPRAIGEAELELAKKGAGLLGTL